MTTRQALNENEALVKRWKDHPRVNAWLSLRQIIVNTQDLRLGIAHLADELDTGIHTHLSEGTYEVDYTVDNYNLRPPEYFEKLGIFTKRLHCAHSAFLTPSDVDLYAKHDVSACHCAFGNYSLAPHRLLDMIRAKNPRRARHRRPELARLPRHVPGLPLRGCSASRSATARRSTRPRRSPYAQMLKQACRGGAAAAQLGDKLGSLEVGKLADIVLVGHSDYDQFTSLDPTLTIAQNAGRAPRPQRRRRRPRGDEGARIPHRRHRADARQDSRSLPDNRGAV